MFFHEPQNELHFEAKYPFYLIYLIEDSIVIKCWEDLEILNKLNTRDS